MTMHLYFRLHILCIYLSYFVPNSFKTYVNNLNVRIENTRTYQCTCLCDGYLLAYTPDCACFERGLVIIFYTSSDDINNLMKWLLILLIT